MHISIAKDFTDTPGPRFKAEGDFSGEQFLEEILEPKFLQARNAREKLTVDLDGTEGYATSFLEAAFGGLARKYNAADVLATLVFKCEDEPLLDEEIRGYISDTKKK